MKEGILIAKQALSEAKQHTDAAAKSYSLGEYPQSQIIALTMAVASLERAMREIIACIG